MVLLPVSAPRWLYAPAQLSREVRRRLLIIRHVEEIAGNVGRDCRSDAISRQERARQAA